MARSKKARSVEEAEMNMSSMIDVVFLLLIYFVVTQKPIIEDVHLPSDLPSPNPGAPPDEPPPPPFKIEVLEVGGDGVYRLDGVDMKIEQLAARLEGIERDVTVLVQCDPNAYHRKLIQLLDLLGSKKFTKLNIIDDGGRNPFRR